jgi:hypothetical protein
VAASRTPAIGYNRFPVLGECTSCARCKTALTASLRGAYLELPDGSNFPGTFSFRCVTDDSSIKRSPIRCRRTFALPEARGHRSLTADFYRDSPQQLNDGNATTSLHWYLRFATVRIGWCAETVLKTYTVWTLGSHHVYRPEDTIHASQETITVSVMKTNRSLLFRKVIVANREHHKEHTNTPSGQSAETLNRILRQTLLTNLCALKIKIQT